MNLKGLLVCIGKGIPLRHLPGDIIHWYPETMKTPEEIFFFMKEVSEELVRLDELPTEPPRIYVYTLSPQIIAMVGGRDTDADREDAVVLCPKHLPNPLVDPPLDKRGQGPRGVLLEDWMAHFSLGDLYLRYELKCIHCDPERKGK